MAKSEQVNTIDVFSEDVHQVILPIKSDYLYIYIYTRKIHIIGN